MRPIIQLKKVIWHREPHYEVLGFSGIEDAGNAPDGSAVYVTEDGRSIFFSKYMILRIGDIMPKEEWERRLPAFQRAFAKQAALIAKLDAETAGWEGLVDVVFSVGERGMGD